MRIALTGASGFIGAAIARAAVAGGHTVTGLVRATSRRDHLEGAVDRFVEGDQGDPASWERLLDGADAVVANAVDWEVLKSGDLARHLRANVTGPIEFLAASAPRPFVFMSSIAVHHQMLPRWNGRIDEDHPTRPGGLYGAAKAAVEAHLFAEFAASGRHVVALRPCAVYGLDPRAERSIGWPIVGRLRRRERFSRAGGGKFVHVDDVAAATVAAIERPAAAGRVYNLVDLYARWADWASIIAEEAGLDAVEIDDSSPATPKNTFDVSQTRTDLGVAMDRGLEGIRGHVRTMLAEIDAVAPTEP